MKNSMRNNRKKIGGLVATTLFSSVLNGAIIDVYNYSPNTNYGFMTIRTHEQGQEGQDVGDAFNPPLSLSSNGIFVTASPYGEPLTINSLPSNTEGSDLDLRIKGSVNNVQNQLVAQILDNAGLEGLNPYIFDKSNPSVKYPILTGFGDITAIDLPNLTGDEGVYGNWRLQFREPIVPEPHTVGMVGLGIAAGALTRTGRRKHMSTKQRRGSW